MSEYNVVFRYNYENLMKIADRKAHTESTV